MGIMVRIYSRVTPNDHISLLDFCSQMSGYYSSDFANIAYSSSGDRYYGVANHYFELFSIGFSLD